MPCSVRRLRCPMVPVSGVNAPALMFVLPPVSVGENGKLAPGQALWLGLSLMSNVDEYRTAYRPGVKYFGRVRAAVRRGCQRHTFATEEFQLGVFERRLRQVFKRRGDPPRRAQRHLPRKLQQHTRFRFFSNEIHREQAPERVLVLIGQIHRAHQFVFEQRRLDVHRADLRRIRTERRGQRRRELGRLCFGFAFGVKFPEARETCLPLTAGFQTIPPEGLICTLPAAPRSRS